MFFYDESGKRALNSYNKVKIGFELIPIRFRK
jgi:hypothetical protein